MIRLNVLRNQRGFMLLNVVFLTLITAFAATILLNAAVRVKNQQATLRLIALNLANEQFAQLESLAAAGVSISGSYPFLGDKGDLTNDSFRKKNSATSTVENPAVFTVETQVSGGDNLRTVKVTVKIVGDENFEFKAERTMRVAQ